MKDSIDNENLDSQTLLEKLILKMKIYQILQSIVPTRK